MWLPMAVRIPPTRESNDAVTDEYVKDHIAAGGHAKPIDLPSFKPSDTMRNDIPASTAAVRTSCTEFGAWCRLPDWLVSEMIYGIVNAAPSIASEVRTPV